MVLGVVGWFTAGLLDLHVPNKHYVVLVRGMVAPRRGIYSELEFVPC